MDFTHNFSLGFAQGTELKANAADPWPKRQTLQQISTATSLVSLSLGFLIVGMLIIMNRNQADVNGLTGGNPVALAGGISAMLIGTAFLVAAYLHRRSYAKFSLASTIDHQSAPPSFVAIHAVGYPRWD
jgi:hypothetical protein